MVKRSRGFALVLTLAVLMLAAAVLVSVGQASIRHAAEARAARTELQRRCGIMSCRRAVLPRVEELLLLRERAARRPIASMRTKIMLGGQEFDLRIADEQAKANINVLLDEFSAAVIENRLRESLSGTGLSARIRLRPGPPPATAPAATTSPASRPFLVPPLIFAYGQIFDAVSPRELQGTSDLLTCWGSGPINIRRATPSALRLAASPPLTGVEIDRILKDRTVRVRPPGTHFTESSTCHSIWITVSDGRREWHEFTVLDQSAEDRPQVRTLVW